MMLSNKLMGGVTAGEDAAEGVDFDGVNDYLSRSTDLAGNVDSTTFTFSAWVYFVTPFDSSPTILNIGTAPIGAYFQLNSEGLITIGVQNDSGSLYSQLTSTLRVSSFGWNHILVSYDVANTNNARLYVNDILFGHSIAKNDSTFYADFTKSAMEIGNGLSTTTNYCGRLSNIFLDYTYRDLSIEANRRLFITAEGKPTPTATLKALNPILYLPMKDAATAHINEGTGGNFTLNGTIATSGRGANQDNCVASYFDGAADYLSRTSALSGSVESSVFTFACCFNWDGTSGQKLFEIAAPPNVRFQAAMDGGSPSKLVIAGETSTGVVGINASLSTLAIVARRNYVLVVSCDLSNTANRRIVLNGVTQSVTWTTYSNVSIAFNSSSQFVGAQNGGVSLWKGNIGELYFDTKYIDLATSNPFWNSETNKPIPVRKVISNTGVTPLIAMPLDASNAGKNYGTGGDFTVNSGPYVGARGASEYWGNWASVAVGAGNYISKTNLNGVSDSSTWSISCFFRKVDTSAVYLLASPSTSYGWDFLTIKDDNGYIKIRCCNAANNGWILGWASNSGTLTTSNTVYCLQVSRNGASLAVYLNGSVVSGTFDTNTSTPTSIASKPYVIGKPNTTDSISGQPRFSAELYFTTDYIDFSQEANRLKFRDAFGNPVALLPQIEAGTIPNPAIYMRFDPTNFGKNLGTGGDFTVNGTITDGGQL